ncbi:RluA family pseudouridine synthase [Mesomycoplasma conjunctivae]|uniref:RluA family pseudouridine synthase n=1 Tax=Mesomycoplasma conjunctivae TaxID=45361 RepID=UPI003DA320F8
MHTPNKIELIYQGEKARIDLVVAKHINVSRKISRYLIEANNVKVDNKVVNKVNFLLREGQFISILNNYQEPKLKVEAQKVDFEIVYQDNDIIVINKPKNLVVHPGNGNWDKTLVNGLLHEFATNLSDVNGEIRPGIVHRLDKDTSGLLLVAKNNQAHKYLAKQLENHEIERKYIAIVVGKIPHTKMKINLPIGRDNQNRTKKVVSSFNSKNAITNVELINTFVYKNEHLSIVKCILETGRTHQIRVHLSHIGYPIYGDPVYGKKIDDLGQRLHAYEISFKHLDGRLMNFKTEIPDEFKFPNIKIDI